VTTTVIDASVAVKWVLRETGSDAADALLDDHDLIAPALWLVESGNALWRRARIGEITADEAKARLSELRNAPVVSLAIEPHVEQALDLAVELGRPVYDCLYLTVALRHRTQMVTADRRFAAAMNGSHFSGIVRLLAP
jgi:predicted nucleic acid-binding protein